MSFKDRWQREKARKAARKATKRQQRGVAVGVAWYSREQWEELPRVVEDRSELDETYEDWRAQVKEAVDLFSAQGFEPVRVEVDVAELVEWCREHGRPVNGEARSAFAGHLLNLRLEGEDGATS